MSEGGGAEELRIHMKKVCVCEIHLMLMAGLDDRVQALAAEA